MTKEASEKLYSPVWEGSHLIEVVCQNQTLDQTLNHSLGIPTHHLPDEINFHPESGLIKHLSHLWDLGVLKRRRGFVGRLGGPSDPAIELGQSFFLKTNVNRPPTLTAGPILEGDSSSVAHDLYAFREVIFMHIHPIDRPPSPSDFCFTVVNGGNQAAFIETPTLRFLLLRTDKTSRLDFKASQTLISQKVNQFTQICGQTLDNAVNRKCGSSLSYEQLGLIDSQTQLELLLPLSRELGIAVYLDVNKTGHFSRYQNY